MKHIKRLDGLFAYFDMSDVQPVIRWTNSWVLAYPFSNAEDARAAIGAYLRGIEGLSIVDV